MRQIFADAIDYVRENKTWTEADEQVAMAAINERRCSIEQASRVITDEICALMGEYLSDNDHDANEWEEELTADEIYWML